MCLQILVQVKTMRPTCPSRNMTKRAPFSLILVPGQVILLLTLMAVFAVSVSAQSGRKAPKSKSAPPPEPESVPAPMKPVEKEKEKARLTFIVGIDRDLSFVSIPTYFSEGALRACADRLDQGPSVDVSVAPRDVNRGEAVKRAKAEKEAFVVWLNLRSDSMNASGAGYQDLYLEYVVFTPQTGKVATSGRTYQRSVGRVIGVPQTSSAAVEYALKEAGRAAAERILDAMRGRISEDRVPG